MLLQSFSHLWPYVLYTFSSDFKNILSEKYIKKSVSIFYYLDGVEWKYLKAISENILEQIKQNFPLLHSSQQTYRWSQLDASIYQSISSKVWFAEIPDSSLCSEKNANFAVH